ncbi:MAG: nitrogen regulation protein NR(I) [Gammaproteobacteria bacterium]
MSKQHTVWVVDDDKSIRWVLEKAFMKEDLEVVSFDKPDKMLARFAEGPPDVIISDIRMPGTDGISLLENIKQQVPDIPVIIMTAYSDLDRTVSSFEGGAFEYLSKPFDVDEVITLVKRAVEQKQVRAKYSGQPADTEIIGSAPAMQEVFRAIGRLSCSHLTVLITGESGTGKERVARALYRHSPRSGGPFIALNTAAIPRELLESELFGHEKGSFTGANARRTGRFEQAHGGTLFLDEIGDMPADLQSRLLRVLADGEFYRVGGHEQVKVDVRVITATHQDLGWRVKKGSFREDLFHRLNVIRVHVPPLRERAGDIPALTDYFLQQAANELAVGPKQMSAQAQTLLNRFSWPGNVRQLENVCRWVTVMAPGKEIHGEDLPPELKEAVNVGSSKEGWETEFRRWVESNLLQGETRLLSDAVPRFERIMIKEALKQSGGRRQDAAKLLGWGRNTLTRKIKSLGMDL